MRPEEYQQRRKALAEKFTETTLLVVLAATPKRRNGDADFRYRQHSDFWYLTGHPEPEAALLMLVSAGETQARLFLAPNDAEKEKWDGRRIGLEAAQSRYPGLAIANIADLSIHLNEALAQATTLSFLQHQQNRVQPLLEQAYAHNQAHSPKKTLPAQWQFLEPILHPLRRCKSKAEIACLQQAADHSTVAHHAAMQVCRPGAMEYELEATLEYHFRRQGCSAPAYSSIVAGGENACILHYIDNQRPLRDGDLVLIDAGGEYQGYAADITRTIPVNGRFSAEQRALYQVVLHAQQAVIDAIQPGLPWPRLQEIAIETLTAGLVDLKLLNGRLEDLIAERAFARFYYHACGHWLGLDVHDAGGYFENGQPIVLAPNMVLTVEPGLYISHEHTDIDPRWRGMGIRIEDDVQVTTAGAHVLSQGAVKQIDDIERRMAAGHD